MNMRIFDSLVMSLGLYAGAAFGMLAPTSQQLGAAASRGATALGAAASRYRVPRPGGVSTSRAFSTATVWSPAEEAPTSYAKRGPGLGQRSALFRSTQIRRPAGSRPMSTSARSNDIGALTKQEAATFLGIDINASPEQAEEAALTLRKKYYTKMWHPDPLIGGEGSLSMMKLIDEAESLFKPRNVGEVGDYTNVDNRRNVNAIVPLQNVDDALALLKEEKNSSGGSGSSSNYNTRIAALLLFYTFSTIFDDYFNNLAGNNFVESLKIRNEIQSDPEIKKLEYEISKIGRKMAQRLVYQLERLNVPETIMSQYTLQIEQLGKQYRDNLYNAFNKEPKTEKLSLVKQATFEYKEKLKAMVDDIEDMMLKLKNRNLSPLRKLTEEYEQTTSEHKKTFEKSLRRYSLAPDTYNFELDGSVETSLQNRINKLKEEIDKEKNSKSSYIDWARGHLLYRLDKFGDFLKRQR